MKPRIVLIPNLAAWIIGEMSKHIIRTLGDRFDFYFIPESLLYRRPDLIRGLLPGVSLVHAMNESATSLLAERIGGEFPPILTWIHHITRWSADHDISARRSEALIACTPSWKARIEELNPHPCPVHLIRHGVDTEFFQRTPGARARLGIPLNAFTVGFIAHRGSDTDNSRKGFPILMEVVKSVARQIPNFNLVMVGPGWSEPVSELQASGIRAQYINYLPRSEVPALFSALDVYLMTSRVEGGPCTVLESMACGTPVVATRVGLVPDVVVDGANGFTCEVDDINGLCERVLAVTRNPELAAESGIRARITAEKNSWQQSLMPLGDIYDRYLRSVRPAAGTPRWMDQAETLTGPAHAADVIANAWDDWQNKRLRNRTILTTMSYGLEGLGPGDILRGAGLLAGMDFRT